jgi:hypothetical protein
MQEIFGPAACITGIMEDLGGDSESVQRVSRYNDKAIMFGLPDPDPARNIHGYRGSVQELGRDTPSLHPLILRSCIPCPLNPASIEGVEHDPFVGTLATQHIAGSHHA